MAIVISPQGDVLHLEEHLNRLKGLVADLEALKSGRHPDVDGLKHAAHIHGWVIDSRPVPCLRGYVEGHPDVRSGRMAATSELWVWAPAHGYARTLSRFYSLGPVAGDGMNGRVR